MIENTCYAAGVNAWAQSHGYPDYAASLTDDPCFTLNPGEDVQLRRDFNGDGQLETLNIPAGAFGIPKPKHKYIHLTLELSHRNTNEEPHFLDVSYTWARAYGNYEGLIDLGRRVNGYIGQSPAFDYPEIMAGSNGNLAGDVRHSLTASGVYFFKNGLRLGAIARMHTGSPLSCYGTYPDADNAAYNDGAVSHYCNNQLTYQGRAGRLPFFWQFDVSVGYDWKIGERNKLSLDLQVQNLTNRNGTIDRDQVYDTSQILGNGGLVHSVNYRAPSWQAPRMTNLSLRYTFD